MELVHVFIHTLTHDGTISSPYRQPEPHDAQRHCPTTHRPDRTSRDDGVPGGLIREGTTAGEARVQGRHAMLWSEWASVASSGCTCYIVVCVMNHLTSIPSNHLPHPHPPPHPLPLTPSSLQPPPSNPCLHLPSPSLMFPPPNTLPSRKGQRQSVGRCWWLVGSLASATQLLCSWSTLISQTCHDTSARESMRPTKCSHAMFIYHTVGCS